MTYYKKDGYVVDAKETITYSSPIIFFQKDQKKITIKEHCKNFNEWWVYSFYAVTSRRPQIYKKEYVQNQNKKRQNILLTNTINETKRWKSDG